MTWIKKCLVFSVVFVALSGLAAGEDRYDPAKIGARIMRQLLSTEPCDYKPIGYDGDPYGKGVWLPYAAASWWANGFDFAALTGDVKLAEELAARYEPYKEGGRYANSVSKMYHVDDAIAGVVPLAVYLFNGDLEMRKRGLVYADTQWTPPCEKSLKERHAASKELQDQYWAQGYTPQTRLWIDDMYMIIALQTMAYRATGERKYLDRTAKEMCFYLDEIQIKEGAVKGLFYHAPDVPFVWGRGDGWMAAGMALVLSHLDKSNPYREKILRGYLDMMEALLRFQRPDGLWGQLVDDPEIWAETSGSAMFTYAFLAGVRNGWLERERYAAPAEKAWKALCDRLDEHANLSDVCIGTGKCNSHRYYVNRRRINGDPHGEAPMMWCVNELLRAGVKPAAELGGPETSRLFERHVDRKSGMTGYVLRDRLGFNQQTFYFTQKSMTDDGRFLLFEVADEDRRFVKRMAMVDFVKDELVFVRGVERRTDAEMAYLDTETDELWYLDGDAFYKRCLLVDPQKPVLVCKVPVELTAHGKISRMFTHLTLNRAKTKAFFDVRYADDLMVQGVMDFTTGRFEKWADARGICINHGSINPVDDTLGLCAQEVSFTDSKGVRHDIKHNADGVYPRLQLTCPGIREMIEPALCNGATHETWAEDGKGFIYCSCGVNYHDLKTDEQYRLTSLYAAHSTMTADNRYLVFDRQTEEDNWYRGCPWNVIFWNRETGRFVYVYYGSPALNAKGEGHALHPDPHPHFCCKDRYIVCTLNDTDRRMNVFVAPVAPLISATAGEKNGKPFKTAHARRYRTYPER